MYTLHTQKKFPDQNQILMNLYNVVYKNTPSSIGKMASFSIFQLDLEKTIADNTADPVLEISSCKAPILCTLNKNGVSLWNVQSGEKYFSKQLSSRPNWISLHPSGFQLCIGFEECVKCCGKRTRNYFKRSD